MGGTPEYVVGRGWEGLDALCGSLEDDGLDPDGPATAVGASGDAVVAIVVLSGSVGGQSRDGWKGEILQLLLA